MRGVIILNNIKREIPLDIPQKEGVLRRITPHNPKRKRVEEKLKRRWSGHKGELALDYHLRFLPFKSYQVLRGVRLRAFGNAFQIDTPILNPHAIFIVEAKNHKGTITYNEEKNHFEQTVNGFTKHMDDPLLQVTEHKQQLEEWLRYRGIYGYPVIPLVAFTNPSTVVIPPQNHKHNWSLMNAVHIVDKIKEIEKQYKDRPTFNIDKIRDALLAENTPLEQDILQYFSIKSSDIIRGVMCPKCESYAMEWVRLRWQCPNCGYRSNSAHLLALADYFLLGKDSITNREFRDFALVSDEGVALRMLKSSGLEHDGKTKGRFYKKPDDLIAFVKHAKDLG